MDSKNSARLRFIHRALGDVFQYVRDVFWVFETPHEESHRDISDAYRKEIPGFPFVCAKAAYAYSKPFADDLKLFKYRAERSVMEKFDHGLKNLAVSCADVVPNNAFVAYPPSPASRTLLRGYDHTALLAERFAKHAGYPVVRIVRTPFFRPKQSVRNQSERMSNVSNKFFLPAWTKAYSWRPVIFFDDVISSGSTALECARILAENGNTEIYGFFLASSTGWTSHAPSVEPETRSVGSAEIRSV